MGGEISYKCLGNNDYEVTLTIYRDCFSNGAAFDASAVISVYDVNNNLIKNTAAPINTPTNLPIVAPNNCTVLPLNVCTEKAVYVTTINLPPILGGYTISSQRCCRNATINNIPNPGGFGNTYTIEIPSNLACNSSPHFNADPPVALCLGQQINLDMSATETDGDSIFYTLCEFYNGGGTDLNNPGGPNSVKPDPATPPPYAPITFNGFLSATYPIPASPAFALNPATGILTGTPIQVGQFVFGICVEEYRNGVLLSTLRRDFQFNISGACQAIISRIEPQVDNPNNVCAGKTVSLNEQCINANTYFWDFGDPTTTNDNSTLAGPMYTYPDTGFYTIMLVAEPNTTCADTAYEIFHVVDPPQPSFTYSGSNCFDVHNFNFTSYGDFTPNATYTWDFGNTVTANVNSVVPNPTNISWRNAGAHFVKLSVEDNGCLSEISDTIILYERPQLKHQVPIVRGCLPVVVDFTDSSKVFGNVIHFWDFGDSKGSALASPTHTYEKAGIYDVTHTLITTEGCRDTLRETFPLAVEVWPLPQGNLEVSKEKASIFHPFFTIRDTSNQFRTETFVPGRGYLEDIDSVRFKIQDTGYFNVVHVTYNGFGCTDTIIQNLRVIAPLRFYVPNAFTPNGDGLNETFDVSILGVNEYYIKIYDRWGKRLFESNNQEYSWNGKLANSGGDVPIGYYWYLLRVIESETGVEHRQEGTIALMR